MDKINLGSTIPAYPMPVSLVGVYVDGKPNFLAVAWFTMASYKPPRIAIALGKGHYTNPGIRENKTFSVCLPSEDMVEMTDYCGIVSGKKTDKSNIFDLFYGELKTAPLIRDCPLGQKNYDEDICNRFQSGLNVVRHEHTLYKMCVTAQKMRVGPSEPAGRSRVSFCVGLRP